MNKRRDAGVTTDAKSDFLVSVVVADDSDGAQYRNVLLELARKMEDAFHFWEVIVAVPEAGSDRISALRAELKGIPNLRLLQLGAAGNFYRRRLAGVTEAIGDVVVLSALDEIESIDLTALASHVYNTNEAHVLAQRGNVNGITSIVGFSLGALSGYRIDQRDTLTIGFPRSTLENVLSRPDAEILLRFEPLSGMLSYRRIHVAADAASTRRRWRDWRRRFALSGDMMISSSPRLLRAVAFVAFLVACIALAYGLYAVLVWLLKAEVAEGWLTMSLLQSLTTCFLGVSISAISMGLVRIFDFLSSEGRYAIVDEINTVDLIGNIKAANVDLAIMATGSQPNEPDLK